MSKPRALRELIAQGTVVMPGAFNALSAIQIERAGFPAVYVSGAGLAAARGLPDIGLLTMSEVAADAATIAGAVSIPALADADTGFGAPLGLMRTVRTFERAGVAGIHVEDQDDPKKCGHLAGKRIVPVLDMTRKIAAAVEAREDPDFLIVARTDARAVEGVAGAIRRARAYAQAGADLIFPEALESAEEFRAFAQGLAEEGVKVPLVVNMTEFGRTPYLSVHEFEQLGYRIILFPLTALRVATKQIEALLLELKASGTQQAWLSRMLTREQLYDLLRYADYQRRDAALYEKYGHEQDT